MSFEIDLRSRLVADGTVAGIVGTRIYWEIRPQGSALPAIVLGTTFGARAQHMEGVITVQGNRIQFDCLASSKAVAVNLRNAVMAEIESAAIVGDTEFQAGFVNLYRDTAEDTAAGVVHDEMIDATIWFNEYVS
jgi:hypothetical protein